MYGGWWLWFCAISMLWICMACKRIFFIVSFARWLAFFCVILLRWLTWAPANIYWIRSPNTAGGIKTTAWHSIKTTTMRRLQWEYLDRHTVGRTRKHSWLSIYSETWRANLLRFCCNRVSFIMLKWAQTILVTETLSITIRLALWSFYRGRCSILCLCALS